MIASKQKLDAPGSNCPFWFLGCFKLPDLKKCERAVVDAIESCYRHIDTAASYLDGEAVGRGIRASAVDRKNLFIAAKLWIQRNGNDGTKGAFERSVKRLQLDYLDSTDCALTQ